MKYMVMEICKGYAVVLGEDGRFIKAANRQYQVGQTVTEIAELQKSSKRKSRRWAYSLAGMAACLLLVAGAVLRMYSAPYASIYMSINPQVRIDVNRQDVVVGLEGVNDDGRKLTEGYSYRRKHLDLVTDEMVDKAIAMGYLSAGGQITLQFDAQDQNWVVNTGSTLPKHINEHLTEKISVTIRIGEEETEGGEVVIPVETAENAPTPSPALTSRPRGVETSYGESDYSAPLSASSVQTPPPAVTNSPVSPASPSPAILSGRQRDYQVPTATPSAPNGVYDGQSDYNLSDYEREAGSDYETDD